MWRKIFVADTPYWIDGNLSCGSLDSLRGHLLYRLTSDNMQYITDTPLNINFDNWYLRETICNLNWTEGNPLPNACFQVSEANLEKMFKTKRSSPRQMSRNGLKRRGEAFRTAIKMNQGLATYVTTTSCLRWIWLCLSADNGDFPHMRHPSISSYFWEDCS